MSIVFTNDEELLSDEGEVQFFQWNGKYTRGNISYRGTRLWFQDGVATYISYENINFITNDEDIDAHIRTHNILALIDILNGEDEYYKYIDLSQFIIETSPLIESVSKFISLFDLSSHCIANRGCFPCAFYLWIHKGKMDLIKEELLEVNKYAQDNGMLLTWI